MKITKQLFLLVFAILFFCSCKVEEASNFTSLENFYASQLNPEQFNFSSDNDIVFTGAQGTKVTIPKSAFPDENSNIQIFFREIMKKSDLILTGLSTNTYGENWLESGGTFFLHLRQSNGVNLLLEDNITLEFPISENISNINDMSVWTGDRERLFSEEETTAADFGTWRNVSANNENNFVRADSLANEYFMTTRDFNWINCDYVFNSDQDLTRVTANFTNSDLKSANVNFNIVLKNINSVLRLNSLNDPHRSFPIPEGEEAFLVGMGVQDEKLFYYLEPFIISKGLHFDIELEETSEANLKEKLKVLDE